MIAVKMKRDSKFKKSLQAHIADLVTYVRDARQFVPEKMTDEAQEEKVLIKGAFGMTFDNERAQLCEIIADCADKKHMPDHWVISWPTEEKPSEQQLHEAAQVFVEEMGMEGHKVIYAAHGNTSHTHLHIIIDRVSPETGKIVKINGGFDKIQAQKALCVIAEKQGWRQLPGIKYQMTPEGPQLREKRWQKQLSAKAKKTEIETGQESLERAALLLVPVIDSATSWQDLHEKLAPYSVSYHPCRGGAVLDFRGAGTVKASQIDRSLKAMEERFGKFQQAHIQLLPYEPKPLQVRYDVGLAEIVLALVMKFLGFQKQAENLLYSKQQLERNELRQIKFQTAQQRYAAQSVLREEHKLQKEELKEGQNMGVQKIKRMGFMSALLAAEKHNLVKRENNITVEKLSTTFERMHAALGADFYRVTAKKDKENSQSFDFVYGKKDFPGRETKNGTFLGVTKDEISSYYAEMIRNDNGSFGYGCCVSPADSSTTLYIVVDDIETPEQIEQAKIFAPAVQTSSHTGSFQMILKVHATAGASEAELARAKTLTAQEINRLCGDKSNQVGSQSIRFPLFLNKKHTNERAVLISAEDKFCPSAQQIFERNLKIVQEQGLSQEAEIAMAQPVLTADDLPKAEVAPCGVDYSSWYRITARAILDAYKKMNRPALEGRTLDVAVASRLRAMGYAEKDAALCCAYAHQNGDLRGKEAKVTTWRQDVQEGLEQARSAYHSQIGHSVFSALEKNSQIFLQQESREIEKMLQKQQEIASEEMEQELDEEQEIGQSQS